MAGMEMEQGSTEMTLMPKFKTFGEIFEYCNWIATSNIVPDAYKNRPADIFVAAQYGNDIGLKFMTSIQNIAIIGGRPALPSDIKLAMVRGNKLLEYMKEATDEDIRMTGIAWCEMKRVGVDDPIRHAFSVEDAKQAGLWERRGNNNYPTPWVTHKWRMLQLKPRDMVLRDLFGDVFKGLHSIEEARDIEILESDRTPQAQIEQRSQPDTKGKEILEAERPPLKPEAAKEFLSSIEGTAPIEQKPAEEATKFPENWAAKAAENVVQKPSEPVKPAAGAEIQKALDEGLLPATEQLRKAVDACVERVRKLPGGSAALLKVWTQYKIPVAQFAKGSASSALSNEQIDGFSIEIEKIENALTPKK